MLSGDARHALVPRLIGRDQDLATFRHALLRAGQGVPSVVVISGPGGTGKSRLCAEAVSYAHRLGATVVEARAVEPASTIPFATLISGLRWARAQGQLADSDLVEVMNAFESPDEIGAPRADRRAVESFRQLVSTAERTMLVVIDDLHHCDEPSVRLLSAVASQMSDDHLNIVIAGRRNEGRGELMDVLRSCAPPESVTELHLGPLGDESAAELTRCTARSLLSADTVEAIVQSASGNPLVLVTLSSAADASGAVPDELPREVVTRLLPGGSSIEQLAKGLAAAAPMGLASLPALAESVGLTTPAGEDAFDALVAAGNVMPVQRGEYTLVPEILRRSLYRGLGVAERHRLHRSLAGALGRLRSEGEPVDVRTLAHHAAAGALGVDADAAELAASAGDLEVGQSPIDAAGWYQRAVELSPLRHDRRATHLAHLTHALFRAGAPAEAVRRGREALALLAPGTDRTRAVVTVVEALLAEARPDEAMTVLEAEHRYGELDPMLLSLRAASSIALGDHAAAAKDLARAKQGLTSAVGVPEAPLVVHSYAAYLAHARGDVAATRASLRDVLVLAPSAPQYHQEWAYGFGAFMLASARMPDDAEPLLRDARRLQVHNVGAASWTDLAEVMIHACRGEWHQLLTEGARLEEEFAVADNTSGAAILRALMTMTRWAQGRADAPDRPGRALPGIKNEAWALRLLLHSAMTSGVRPPTVIGPGWVAGLVAPYAPLFRPGGTDYFAGGPHPAQYFSEVVALLAAAELGSDLDAAEAAVELAQSLGLPFYVAEAKLAAGTLGTKATDHLTDAWWLFDEMGAERYRQRAAAALRIKGLPVPRKRRRPPGSLTQSEWQVVELVSKGLRNRDIAEQLSYSLRTVETYITRVYEKTGIRSRVGLVQARNAGALH